MIYQMTSVCFNYMEQCVAFPSNFICVKSRESMKNLQYQKTEVTSQ